jgi:hypothetical protein
MKICKYLLKILSSIPLNIHIKVGLLDHMVVQFLILWGLFISILFPVMSEPFHIPITSNQRFQFCHILVNTWCFCICDSGNPIACELTFYCGCVLPFTGDYWFGISSYKYLCALFLKKGLFKSFAHFLTSCFLAEFY